MASGKFSSMNKVRPGAYINFETSSAIGINVGTRGIATMAIPLSWGGEGKIIELTGNDMVTGNSLAKVGLISTDANALLLNLALQNCNVLKLYNTNAGGVKANTTLTGGLVITAKHPGTFGNKIAIVIKAIENSRFSVETYADGYFIESQKVSAINQLVSNDFVDFSGNGSLGAISSTLLSGGTNGTSSASTYLPLYFNALRATKWNTMAVTSTTASDIASVVNFITEMREDEGKYVQAVVANYADADYEGIINNVNGVVLEDGTSVSAANFTAWVAGATAGAEITESLTGKVVTGATSIVGGLDNDAIILGLAAGKFILSLNQNGNIKVEKDINSLHTFTIDKNYTFSKNRIIRELDEIGSSIEDIWETTYLGKVTNNEAGRTLFKSSIINYLSDLQNRGAIEDFESSSVIVEAGNDIDSVIANIAIKPLDSMEFLYMTVDVNQ